MQRPPASILADDRRHTAARCTCACRGLAPDTLLCGCNVPTYLIAHYHPANRGCRACESTCSGSVHVHVHSRAAHTAYTTPSVARAQPCPRVNDSVLQSSAADPLLVHTYTTHPPADRYGSVMFAAQPPPGNHHSAQQQSSSSNGNSDRVSYARTASGCSNARPRLALPCGPYVMA